MFQEHLLKFLSSEFYFDYLFRADLYKLLFVLHKDEPNLA
jgi:hypothetical protein